MLVSVRLRSAVSRCGEAGGSHACVPMMLVPPRHGSGVCWQEVGAFLCCLLICTALTLSWGLLEQ